MSTTVQTQLLLHAESPDVLAKLSELVDAAEGGGELEIVAEEREANENESSRRMKLVIMGHTYPTRLVNLPTLVETHKTFDNGKNVYKCGDVGQVVIVYQNEAARRADEGRKIHKAWQHVYQDGISPPLKNCVERRFAKARRRRAKVQANARELHAVEARIASLVKVDDPFAEEILSEDIVPFEPWMLSSDHPNGAIFADDAPLAIKEPWVFTPNKDQYTELTPETIKAELHIAGGDRANGSDFANTCANGEEDDDENDNQEGTQNKTENASRGQSTLQEERGETNSISAQATPQDKRQAFVTRRTQCTDELKIVSRDMESLTKSSKVNKNHAQFDAKLAELTAKQRKLRLEISQLDENL